MSGERETEGKRWTEPNSALIFLWQVGRKYKQGGRGRGTPPFFT